MGSFFEIAGSVLLSTLLLVGGVLGAIGSALKARHMNLSRVNEHGVRVWKSAADSFIAPFQITALWILAAFFAFLALAGFLQLAGQSEPQTPSMTQPSSEPISDVAPGQAMQNLPTERPPATDMEPSTLETPPTTTDQLRSVDAFGLSVREMTSEERASYRLRRSDYPNALMIVNINSDIWGACPNPNEATLSSGGMLISSRGFGAGPQIALRTFAQNLVPEYDFNQEVREIQREWRSSGRVPPGFGFDVSLIGNQLMPDGSIKGASLCGSVPITCSDNGSEPPQCSANAPSPSAR